MARHIGVSYGLRNGGSGSQDDGWIVMGNLTDNFLPGPDHNSYDIPVDRPMRTMTQLKHFIKNLEPG